MISKNDLDKRICDLEGSSNEQTYREYIRETEEEFGIGEMDIEELTQTEFKDYFIVFFVCSKIKKALQYTRLERGDMFN